MKWSGLVYAREQEGSFFEHGNEISENAGKLLSSCTTGGLSGRVQLRRVS
jgi:hypothetical protein